MDLGFRAQRIVAGQGGEAHAARSVDRAAPDAAPDRVVYSTGNTKELPGTVARKEGDPPTGDEQVGTASRWCTGSAASVP